MLNLQNKTITVIGGKRSGMALARLIVRLQGRAKISEKAGQESFSEDFKQWAASNHVVIEYNAHTKEFIEQSDLVVLSPGVPWSSDPVRWAKAKKIPVVGEIEFAFQFCSKPVIAVTGSNGKTTTVTLIRDILIAAGHKVCLCGNVGDPFSKYVLDSDQVDYIVLEVSSFQMEVLLEKNSPFRRENSVAELNFAGFKPHVAAILNFSQNHLDRHKDLDEYFNAKKMIFLNQDKKDFAILNHDDERLRHLGLGLPSKVIFFNHPDVVSKMKQYNPNQLAAMAVVKALGVIQDVCDRVFKDFKGVEHRMEWVRTIAGVDFINDSKATTAEAGRWALECTERPIIMIAGGRDKNIDFSVLKSLVQRKVKHMVVYGESREKLRKVFEDVVHVDECARLDEAVSHAWSLAKKGDCVLLSPMCASFDLFTDYVERGKVFKEIVKNLKAG